MPSMMEWGPPLWFSLHTIASTYPDVPSEDRRQSIVNMMDGLSKNMPCGICGAHLQDYLSRIPIYPSTESKAALEEYIYNLHEDVNERNGKARMHTLEEVRDAFSGKKPWTKFGGYPLPKQSQPESSPVRAEQIYQQSLGSGAVEKSVDWKLIVIICLIVIVLALGSGLTFVLINRRNKAKSL
jgi:hypothetical protein